MSGQPQTIRVSDYLVQRLVEHGISHVFLVTGGGAMHLNDAFGRTKGMNFVACHHEQACAIAAESYYRLTGRMAAVNVTTGPGGTNAITGVYGAYVDSMAMIVVSGNVKWETLVRSTDLPLRQLGDQEVDIVKLVEPITKYAAVVTDPKRIRWHVERALHLARTGRPGPVWLDVPMNVQGALVDPTTLEGYDPKEDAVAYTTTLPAQVDTVLAKLATAKRPVILASSGVRLSGAHAQFIELAERLGIPVTTGWNSNDLLWDEHPVSVGRPGTVGDRAGNFAVQNADLLIIIGCRLNIRMISYDWKKFARAAFKVMVDVDQAELSKPTLSIDLPIHADAAEFLRLMLARTAGYRRPEEHGQWLSWCLERKRRYPVVLPEYWQKAEPVNPYCFVESLFKQLDENETVICADGTACVVTFQAAHIKKGQRVYHNSGCAPMGYELPAAVGASIANGKKRVVCIAGDGSIQMNVQELQTIVTHKLPVKIFLLNNEGYHSIRQTQNAYFKDNPVGCGNESGLGFPDFGKLAAAYGLGYRKVGAHAGLADAVRATLAGDGPQLCEVMLDLAQPFAPKLSSRKLPDGRMVSSPLEDMAPFLPREELRENMLIPLLAE